MTHWRQPNPIIPDWWAFCLTVGLALALFFVGWVTS